MERLIVKSNKVLKTISSSEVSAEVNNLGVIIVYENENIIGFVTYSEISNRWYIELIDDKDDYETLNELLDEYSHLTFKFIT